MILLKRMNIIIEGIMIIMKITPSLVAPYDGGKLKEEVHQAMTDLTNFYRWLAGVNPYMKMFLVMIKIYKILQSLKHCILMQQVH